MDRHSSGCLPGAKFPTFASGRQGRGASNVFKSGVRSPRSEKRLALETSGNIDAQEGEKR
jgi:hypothetical protein